jgi:nitrile hydratase
MTEVQEFQIGQMVNVKSVCKNKHHRVPLYLKGKIGKVTEYLGLVENPELAAYSKNNTGLYPLYRVCFKQTSLWGGEQNGEIYADLAEKWLSKVEV